MVSFPTQTSLASQRLGTSSQASKSPSFQDSGKVLERRTSDNQSKMLISLTIIKTLACVLLLAAGEPVVRADTPQPGEPRKVTRIAPEGLPGHLVLCGAGPVSKNAVKFFATALPKKNAQVVVLAVGKDSKQTKKVLATLQAQESTKKVSFSLAVFPETNKQKQQLTTMLHEANGVWLASMSKAGELTDGQKRTLLTHLRKVLARGGVVGSSGTATLWLAEKHLGSDKAELENIGSGLGLFPDSVFAFARKKQKSGLASVIKSRASYVGYGFGESGALYLRGRRLWVIDGNVTIHLAASKTWPAKRQVLEKSRQYTDLTTLRRSARARAGAEFPPKKIDIPFVKRGTLIIIGGGGTPKGLYQKFVDLAGGPKAKLLILPTAQPDPISNQRRLAGLFRKLGAKSVTVLPGRTRDVVESPEYIEAFQQATGIWFGGGRQWRFVDAYQDTKVHKLMHKVLERNGVIMGSSAGASIQADYMARGAVYGNRNIVAEGYERGLGFLKGVAIDQHFSQRRRLKDMDFLVTKYPQLLGIGIDESTAIIVKKSVADVVGRGKVYFYNAQLPRKKKAIRYVTLEAGGRYDLKARNVLKPYEK